MAAESFTDRLRAEDSALTIVEFEPWPTEGPKLESYRGCYADGTPGPQLLKRMAKLGYTWHSSRVAS